MYGYTTDTPLSVDAVLTDLLCIAWHNSFVLSYQQNIHAVGLGFGRS